MDIVLEANGELKAWSYEKIKAQFKVPYRQIFPCDLFYWLQVPDKVWIPAPYVNGAMLKNENKNLCW